MKQDRFEIEQQADIEVQTSLANRNITEEVISNLKAELTPLIADIQNEAQYKLVAGGLRKAANMRGLIESVCKIARDPAIAFQKACIAKEKELVALVKEVEDPLKAKKDAWDNIEKQRMFEAAQALTTLHQNREKRLLEAEFRKDGQGVWRLRDWSLTQDEVTGLGVVDGELHDWIDDCERQHKNLLMKEQEEKDAAAAIVEQARKDAEELAQLKREKEERLAAEAKALEELERATSEQEAKALAEQQEIKRLEEEAAMLPEPPDDPPVFDEAPPEEPSVEVGVPHLVFVNTDRTEDKARIEGLIQRIERFEVPTLNDTRMQELILLGQKNWVLGLEDILKQLYP